MLATLAKTLVKGAYSLSTFGMDTGFHMVRYRMYQRIGEVMNELPQIGQKALSISGSHELCKLINKPGLQVTDADFPEHNILDLRAFADNSFDYVVSDQVFEHIEGSPQQAMDECYRVLKPGGIAIHTTCFFNEVHAAPSDFWRFTPQGLRLLCRDWSETIEASGWGNRLAFQGFRYVKVPHAKWHPIHKIAVKNDPVAPISVWIIARK